VPILSFFEVHYKTLSYLIHTRFPLNVYYKDKKKIEGKSVLLSNYENSGWKSGEVLTVS